MLAKHVLYQLSYAPKPAPPAALAMLCGQFSCDFRCGRDAADPPVRVHVLSRRALAGRHVSGSRRRPPPGDASRRPLLLRKEVIQPQVPLRLPCYDFIPITTHTLDAHAPCGFGRRLRVQTAFMM